MVGTLIADIKQAKLSDKVVLKIVVKIQLCQDDAYDMAEELAHKNDWIRIECLDENKNMRTIEDISDEIYNNVIGE